MFQTILTILTAATFVAHGLFGCCWHHGHAPAVSGHAKQSTACHGHGHHRHAHHGSERQIAESHHGANYDSPSPQPDLCDEADCVFARTQDGPSLSGDLLAASAVSFSAVLPGDRPLTAAAGFSAFAADSPAASSAPHCALCQVWLI
jgi:hypothetical protein